MRTLGLLLLGLGLGLYFVTGPLQLGLVLYRFAPGLLNSTQAGIQRYVSPDLWDAIFIPVLTSPLWATPVALGALLLLISLLRRR